VSELLGADVDVLDRVAESLTANARRMGDLGALAQQAMRALRTSWSGPDLEGLAQQWERQSAPQLAATCTSLDSCAAQLRAQSAAQRQASGTLVAGSVAFAPMGIPRPVPPPTRGSPVDKATWWRLLSPTQQQQVIRQHPDWIGNSDGLPFAARDLANRALIIPARERLLGEQRRLEGAVADSWFGGAFTNDDAALGQVRDKLTALATISTILGRPGERQLLLVDLSGERAQAAVARGNVDTADNVAVFVPGMSANVTDALTVYDGTMGELQQRSELESSRVEGGRADGTLTATAAVVTWVGYQAPQLGWDLLGDNSVADDHAARSGAAQLVPFLQGIDAARDHRAHLTLLGHSYGSTVAGLALQEHTGVNDAVFFGSPGLGTSSTQNLLLDGGSTYYIEARRDVVGDLGYFGVDPSHLAGIEHASAREATIVDPVTGHTRQLKEVIGHSSYLDDDSTSQYNLSVVVAGVPEQRIRDQGEGFGDILSQPILGTRR